MARLFGLLHVVRVVDIDSGWFYISSSLTERDSCNQNHWHLAVSIKLTLLLTETEIA